VHHHSAVDFQFRTRAASQVMCRDTVPMRMRFSAAAQQTPRSPGLVEGWTLPDWLGSDTARQGDHLALLSRPLGRSVGFWTIRVTLAEVQLSLRDR
jgi:hypothetical protein